jgi:glycerate 2-kinase
MRILVACDSFKEACSAHVACESIARGLLRGHPAWQIDLCPLADGGEGTMAAIASSISTRLEQVRVTGPLGEPLDAQLAWVSRDALPDGLDAMPQAARAHGDIALVEAASCLGLALVPQQRRDPLVTTSYGLGQLIRHAQSKGAALVIVGLGGTCTVDAGIGMAQALGASFPGIRSPAAGGALAQVSDIELVAMASACGGSSVLGACDVNNPLLGPRGAARAFGPQKGASPCVVQDLERWIAAYARRLFDSCTRIGSLHRDLDFDLAVSSPGAGAAGGIGFALKELLLARLIGGVDLVMRCVGFEERLARADMVITGEGRLDTSSFEGKVVSAVVARATARAIPVHVICGANTFDAVSSAKRGIARVETLLEHAIDIDDAKARVEELLADAGERVARGAFG